MAEMALLDSHTNNLKQAVKTESEKEAYLQDKSLDEQSFLLVNGDGWDLHDFIETRRTLDEFKEAAKEVAGNVLAKLTNMKLFVTESGY